MRLLDALGANLAAEQKELARQDFVLFRQLLTPIQVCRVRAPKPSVPGCQRCHVRRHVLSYMCARWQID